MFGFSKEDLVKFKNENLELVLFLSDEQCYGEMKNKTCPAQEVLNKPSEILNDGCYKVMTDNGSRYYSKDNQLHRKDGPAIEYIRGEVIEEWYLNGLLHRENGPAIICFRSRHWYKNGQRHREDGPAIEWNNGTIEWYRNGLTHREDGPAVEYAGGPKWWYRNGLMHREDGPAVEYSNGVKLYYNNGIFIKRTG